jgi:hypothetical protein
MLLLHMSSANAPPLSLPPRQNLAFYVIVFSSGAISDQVLLNLIVRHPPLTPSHPVSSYLIPSHLPPHPTASRLIRLTRLIPSHPTSPSHFTSSHAVSPHLEPWPWRSPRSCTAVAAIFAPATLPSCAACAASHAARAPRTVCCGRHLLAACPQLLAAADLPGSTAAGLATDRFGAKRAAVAFLAAAGSVLLTLAAYRMSASETGGAGVTVALSLLGKSLSSGAFTAIFVLFSTLYPVRLRSAALGSGNMFAKMGAAAAPLLTRVLPLPTSLGLAGCLLFASAAAATTLPSLMAMSEEDDPPR